MNDKINSTINVLPPFKRFCMTIGELPASYLETMSYYETLLWFTKYLQETVIPTINNNAEAVSELQELFVKLQDYVNNYFDNLDVQEEINNKLDEMVEDGTFASIINEHLFSNIIYDDRQECVLYCFFDDINRGGDNQIHFYKSLDGVNLEEIETQNKIYGRDPSLTYINGKYYVATTGYSETKDFVVYVSEDLNTWTQYDININLYNSTYPKRWAPDWFIDSDGKVYIFLSVQYADTEGWGDFKIYRTECTNLENMTFSSPTLMVLSNSPHDNHIDATVIKINDTYNMIVKSENQSELHLERYTSSDLTNWLYVQSDPCNLGDVIEAPIIYKLNGMIYLAGERYGRADANKSYYIIKRTLDFTTYSGEEKIINVFSDLSHGGAVVLPVKTINKLLNYETNKFVPSNNTYNFHNSKLNENHFLIAGGITVGETATGTFKGNFLKLFSVKCNQQYKRFTGCFQITDDLNLTFDSNIKVDFYFGQNKIANLNNSIMNEISAIEIGGNDCKTLAGKLLMKVNETDTTIMDVWLDLRNMDNKNKSIALTMYSNNSHDCDIIYYHDTYANSLTIDKSFRGANYCRTLTVNSKTLSVNNASHTSLTFKFVSTNNNIHIFGHDNYITNANNKIDSDIMLLNGEATIINNNSTYNNLSITVDSYDTDTQEYQITLSDIHTYSVFTIELPHYYKSFFTSYKLN